MALLALLALFLLFNPAKGDFGSRNETSFWDDFTNNFATDLAPIITLFGEQVTKQFLSESTTLLDTIIFSVGPLGILTAVVSCIRVAGGPFLKSIIGRAREPHGMPEIEICSSTSESVCELWSNGGICRVFGRPKILEFIYNEHHKLEEAFPTFDSSGQEIPAKCGIESAREFFQKVQSSSSNTSSSPPESGPYPQPLSHGGGSEESNDPASVTQWTSVSSYKIMYLPFSEPFSRLRQRLKKYLSKLLRPLKKLLPKKKRLQNRRTQGSMELYPHYFETQREPEPARLNKCIKWLRRTLFSKWGQNQVPAHGHAEDDPQRGSQDSDNQRTLREFPPFPNLALNIGTQKSNIAIPLSWAIAIIGIISQSGFFVYATWATRYSATFYENDKIPENPTFFVLTIAGTIFVITGMGLCARIIDRTSKEERFISSNPKGLRILWLQPGGQRIGDQEFDAFALEELKTEYLASWRSESFMSGTISSVDTGSSLLVWLSVGLSIVGWVIQFVGLRGVHSTIALYQLCNTILMSILRALLRSYRRPQVNKLATRSKEVSGHELDWQTFEMEGQEEKYWILSNPRVAYPDGMEGFLQQAKKGKTLPTLRICLLPEESHPNLGKFISSAVQWVETTEKSVDQSTGQPIDSSADQQRDDLTGCSTDHPTNQGEFEPPTEGNWNSSDEPNLASKLMRMRARLAFLTNQPLSQLWGSETREAAHCLKSALQKAGELFVSKHIPFSKDIRSIIWSATCHMGCGKYDAASSDSKSLCFSMKRASDGWVIDEYQIEAVLGLWMWSFQRQTRMLDKKFKNASKPLVIRRGPEAQNIRTQLERRKVHFQESKPTAFQEYSFSNLSVSNIMALHAENLHDPSGPENGVLFSCDAGSSIVYLMAQDIFAIFLERLTILRPKDIDKDLVKMSDAEELVHDMTEVLFSERLATQSEATMTVISAIFASVEVHLKQMKQPEGGMAPR